jgi:hypothetical protein
VEKGGRQHYLSSRAAVLGFVKGTLEEGHSRTVVNKLRGGGYVDVRNSECLLQDNHEFED